MAAQKRARLPSGSGHGVSTAPSGSGPPEGRVLVPSSDTRRPLARRPRLVSTVSSDIPPSDGTSTHSADGTSSSSAVDGHRGIRVAAEPGRPRDASELWLLRHALDMSACAIDARTLRYLDSGKYGVVAEFCEAREDCAFVLKTTRKTHDQTEEAFRNSMVREFLLQGVAHDDIGIAPRPYALVFCDSPARGGLTATILMEKLEGENLSGEREISVELNARITELVDRLHDWNIAHNDLHKGNIWRSPDGTLKLLDFGYALLHGDTDRDHRCLRGEVRDLPFPDEDQLVARQRVDPGRDVWLLPNRVLWHLPLPPSVRFPSRRPFDGGREALVRAGLVWVEHDGRWVLKAQRGRPPPRPPAIDTIPIDVAEDMVRRGRALDTTKVAPPGHRVHSESVGNIELRWLSLLREASATGHNVRPLLAMKGEVRDPEVRFGAALVELKVVRESTGATLSYLAQGMADHIRNAVRTVDPAHWKAALFADASSIEALIARREVDACMERNLNPGPGRELDFRQAVWHMQHFPSFAPQPTPEEMSGFLRAGRLADWCAATGREATLTREHLELVQHDRDWDAAVQQLPPGSMTQEDLGNYRRWNGLTRRVLPRTAETFKPQLGLTLALPPR